MKISRRLMRGDAVKITREPGVPENVHDFHLERLARAIEDLRFHPQTEVELNRARAEYIAARDAFLAAGGTISYRSAPDPET